MIVTFSTLDHCVFVIFFIKSPGPFTDTLQNRNNRESLFCQHIFNSWRNLLIPLYVTDFARLTSRCISIK